MCPALLASAPSAMILYAYDADHWPEALVRATPGGLGAGANIAGGLGIDGPLRSGYLGCEEEGAVEATHADPFGLFLCGRGVEGHEPRWSSQTSRLRPRESPPVAVRRTPKRLARGLVPRRLAVSVALAVSRRVSRSISTKSTPKANRRAKSRREEPSSSGRLETNGRGRPFPLRPRLRKTSRRRPKDNQTGGAISIRRSVALLAPKSVDIYGHIYCHIHLRAGSNREPLRGFVDYFEDGQHVLVDKAADGGVTVAVVLGPAVVRHP